MAYTKQNFTNGNVLDAKQLNALEDAILDLEKAMSNIGSGIKYVESTDTTNLLNLRDFESGTYILSGKFHPYSGSTASISFANALLVNIITKTAGTHVQVFYPVNNCVQFLSITDDSYERTNIYLNDLLTSVTTLENELAKIPTECRLQSPNGTVHKLHVSDDGGLWLDDYLICAVLEDTIK